MKVIACKPGPFEHDGGPITDTDGFRVRVACEVTLEIILGGTEPRTVSLTVRRPGDLEVVEATVGDAIKPGELARRTFLAVPEMVYGVSIPGGPIEYVLALEGL